MTEPRRCSGIFAPVVMPFRKDFSPDVDRLVRQCRWLLEQNVSLAIFGTNSEANSLSVDEKIELLDRLVESGIAPLSLMPGTGLCALTDTARLTEHATSLGCAGTLMLPPFYYKDVSDEGLYRSYAEVIERVGNDRLRIYLYHIPPVSQIGISVSLIERLIKTYPDTVVGIKDSSGDWDNTKTLLDAGWEDFSVFAGSETFLLQTLQCGGAGCISATANINPAAIYDLYLNWRSPDADARQQSLILLRNWVQKFPVIPALKSVVAHYGNDAEWLRVRPPLVELDDDSHEKLLDNLATMKFEMPGLQANTSSPLRC